MGFDFDFALFAIIFIGVLTGAVLLYSVFKLSEE